MTTRDLYNVRVLPGDDGPAPLTDEEERRYRNILFSDLGNQLADHGTTTYPAYSPQDRRRLVEVGRRLSVHWGMPVRVAADDECRMRLSVGRSGGGGSVRGN
ncbi:hypothetical protein ACFYWS_08905 [Streptomyces sp. NPDC002795]|uniref:hypothetical protein n=1 Tax=Streptomyces sp. NPDC002795 TaxID=3364665 RepID=UPI00368C9FDE